MAGLTSKQEKFAQGIASGKSQADAYREAYNVQNMKDNSIHVNASKVLANTKVALRVEELRQPIVEEVGITLKTHLEDLLALRQAAVADRSFSAAISAEIARGKAAGVHVERSVVQSLDKDLSPLEDDGWL